MDEEDSRQLRQQILSAAGGTEIWEIVKVYRLSLQDEDGETHTVQLEVRRFDGAWSLFALSADGDERMLTNLESSPETMIQFAHWEKLRRPPFMDWRH